MFVRNQSHINDLSQLFQHGLHKVCARVPGNIRVDVVLTFYLFVLLVPYSALQTQSLHRDLGRRVYKCISGYRY